MQPTTDLKRWKNPVWDIKDPLKQRWAEIAQTMDTHLNGVCPMHIYFHRRPLESLEPYAIDYRVNNWLPVTKQPFDTALSGIIEVHSEANIEIKVPDIIKNTELLVKEEDVFTFGLNGLTRVRENDPNAVAVIIPLVTGIDDENVSVLGLDLRIVYSKDIDKIKRGYIRFKGGDVKIKDKDHPYYYVIDGGQYTLEYPEERNNKVELIPYPIIKINPKEPVFEYISANVVHEGKYTLRLPYLYGAAAWGDKFCGLDTDVTVQETRYTYAKEIRAKEKCKEVGCVPDPKTGLFVNSATKNLCAKCKGTGIVKDDSPFSVTYVDYDQLTKEGKSIPEPIQYAVPPQEALNGAQSRVDTYYERMCDSLGLVKQNLTNQSGISKEFDYKQQLSLIYKILLDNIRVIKYFYRKSEEFLNIGGEVSSDVYLVGEIGKSSVEELLVKLKDAKTNQSPPHVIMSIIDQIYQKQISQEISETVIDIAKKYDKLYIYGSDEITQARANLGNSIGIREVIIHNTIIDVLKDYFEMNDNAEEPAIIKYLDEYYNKIVPVQTQSFQQATTADNILQ